MLRFILLVTLLITRIHPVRCEGRTWLSHHGAFPPIPPSSPQATAAVDTTTTGSSTTTTATSSGRRGGGDMKKEAWGVATPVSHVTRVTRRQGDSNRYPYASGAFGLEPELGIH